MAFYQSNNVAWYHPLDNLTEYISQNDWTITSGSTFVDFRNGVVGKSLYSETGISTFDVSIQNSGINLVTPDSTARSFLYLIWASGFLNSHNRTIYMGWDQFVGKSEPSTNFGWNSKLSNPTSGITIDMRGDLSARLTFSNNQMHDVNGLSGSPTMLVGYASYPASGWGQAWYSINGQPLLFCGSGACVYPVSSAVNPKIYILGEGAGTSQKYIDEAIIWSGIPMPSDADIMQMYNMGLSGIPLSDFSGSIPPSPTITTNSGSVSLFTTNNKMYRQDDIVFYHQLNNDVEYIKNKSWSETPAATFVNGFINKSLRANTTSGALLTYENSDDVYVSASGTNSLTAVAWVSGLMPSKITSVGWGVPSGTGFRHGIRWTAGAVSGLTIQPFWAGFTAASIQNTIYPTISSGFNFLAAHFSKSTGNWIDCWWSINGSNWAYLSSGILDITTDFGEKSPHVRIIPPVSTSEVIDEACLWKNISLPSNSDLQSLYKLGLSGTPLSESTDTPIITSISGSCNLSLGGPSMISGYMHASTHGNLLMSGSIPLCLIDPSISIHDMACWMRGLGSGTSNFTIEDLLRTGNHDPQIIGKLNYVSATGPIYIKVWDITDGINIYVPIANSGCYPIGNTGRWGWSTQYLPIWNVNHPLYYYKMYAPDGNTFEGQFFMSKPFNRTHYPEANEPSIGKF